MHSRTGLVRRGALTFHGHSVVIAVSAPANMAEQLNSSAHTAMRLTRAARESSEDDVERTSPALPTARPGSVKMASVAINRTGIDMRLRTGRPRWLPGVEAVPIASEEALPLQTPAQGSLGDAVRV